MLKLFTLTFLVRILVDMYDMNRMWTLITKGNRVETVLKLGVKLKLSAHCTFYSYYYLEITVLSGQFSLAPAATKNSYG